MVFLGVLCKMPPLGRGDPKHANGCEQMIDGFHSAIGALYGDGIMDATQHDDQPLTAQRLFDWHAALFPTGRSGMSRINADVLRDDKKGPMQVVSGPIGRERVHYEAPAAARLRPIRTGKGKAALAALPDRWPV